MKTLILIFAFVFSEAYCVLVCKTWNDYLRPIHNKNCEMNPDAELSFEQIIHRWGFTAEQHFVETQDGYELLMLRVFQNVTQKTPVILAHGIFMNGVGFCLRGSKSLPYILGKLGYEIWIINFRGTRYSLGHKHLTSLHPDYWQFSIHELGVYDLPACIDKVYDITGQKAVYIGYSMGSTASYIYSITYPEAAESKLKGIIGLAAVAYYINVKTIVKLLAPINEPFVMLNNVISHGTVPDISGLTSICTTGKMQMYFCESLLVPVFGDDYEQMDPETYPVFLTRSPDLISAKNLNHMIQLGKTKDFRPYNYGPSKNKLVYNQSYPPQYDWSKIKIPVSMFVGENDFIATVENAELINSKLSPKVRCKINVPRWKKFNHLDFINAKDIQALLFERIIKVIEELIGGDCTQ